MKPTDRCTGPGMPGVGSASLLVLSLLVCDVADATGFFVNQQSVRGLGRVNAGAAAAADDPATIFFNPAGLTALWENDGLGDADWRASLGAHLIRPRSDLTNTGSTAATPGTLGMPVSYFGTNAQNPTDPTPVANVYLARRLTEDAYVGIGINSPFGLSVRFDDDWFGRYDAIQASLKTFNLSLVGAYRISPGMAVSAGVDVQYASTKLKSAIPNPLALGGPTPQTDARTKVRGEAWTPGFNIGVLITPTDSTRIGLSYRSAVHHRVSGDATTSGFTGPLADANGVIDTKAKLKLPAVASLGITRALGSRFQLFGQLDWHNWSTFEETRIEFDDGTPAVVRPQNYSDTWAIAVGADYRRSEKLVLRGGVRLDQTPTVDRSRDVVVPDANRLWLGIGATYYHSDRLSVDFALTHVLFDAAKVNVNRGFPGLDSSVHVDADVDSHVNTFAANINFAF